MWHVLGGTAPPITLFLSHLTTWKIYIWKYFSTFVVYSLSHQLYDIDIFYLLSLFFLPHCLKDNQAPKDPPYGLERRRRNHIWPASTEWPAEGPGPQTSANLPPGKTGQKREGQHEAFKPGFKPFYITDHLRSDIYKKSFFMAIKKPFRYCP